MSSPLKMPTHSLSVSVIIPSHNRKLLLCRSLDALRQQTYPLDRFEVVVVLDGCNDGTPEMLRRYSTPFKMRYLEQPQQGASAARNLGANQATGDLLIFLDDDIEARPDLIQSHVNAQQGSQFQVVIGYSPTMLAGEKSFFSMELQSWWEAMFDEINQPGHRYHYTDMLSGNFSIPREVFQSLGGFNPDLAVHEDYDLGWRLIRADVAMVFSPTALGLHHEQSDLKRALQRKYQEGIADVRLGRLYPELIATLLIKRLAFRALLLSHLFRHLELRAPRLGNLIHSMTYKTLDILEKARILWLWRQVLYSLLGHWYLKGVAHELPTWRAMRGFLKDRSTLAQAGDHCSTSLDLSPGLDRAEQILDRERPSSVALYFEDEFIDRMPYQPGAERWRGEHLRAFLINHCLVKLLETFAQKGIIELPIPVDEIEALSQEQAQSPEKTTKKDWR